MAMKDVEYAVPAEVAEQVARAIEPLGLSFAQHESDYWGPYLSHHGLGEEKMKIYLNSDPMFDSLSDPPEEKFFKAKYKQYGVLVDATLEGKKHEVLLNALQKAFPGSERIR